VVGFATAAAGRRAVASSTIWWTAAYPGLAMFVLVLGLSFLGEGLEAWLSGSSQASRVAQ